jgi:hypothetical protein
MNIAASSLLLETLANSLILLNSHPSPESAGIDGPVRPPK